MDFIKKSELGDFTLYDLEDDPAESIEVSASQARKFEELRERMIRLHAEIREEGPRYELGKSKSSAK